MNGRQISLTPTGVAPTPYQWRKARDWLLKLFSCCEGCGKKRNLQVHHQDRDHANMEFDNLRVLCETCHGAAHVGKATKELTVPRQWDGKTAKELVRLSGASLSTVYRWAKRGHINLEERMADGLRGGRRRVEEYHLLTSTQAAGALGLTPHQLGRRLERGLLPEPTLVRDHGLRLFSHSWVTRAKAALRVLTPEGGTSAKS